MINLRELSTQQNRLCDVLPWAYMAADGIVYNKDGSFQRTIEFRGQDLDSVTEHELTSVSLRVNNALKRFGSQWSLFIEARRFKAQDYPRSAMPNFVSLAVDIEREQCFIKEGNHYESKYYMTFCFLPPAEHMAKLQEAVIENSAGKQIEYASFLKTFISETDKIIDILENLMPRLTVLDSDETLTYLHSCVSTKYHPVKTPEIAAYLDAFITDDPLKTGLEPMLGDEYLRAVTIRFFPEQSIPGLLDALNRIDVSYRWMSRFIPLDKTDAEKELKKLKTRWFAKRKSFATLIKEAIVKEVSQMVDSVAMQMADDADDALLELNTGRISFGYYTATVVVMDKDMETAAAKAREVERAINNYGYTCYNEKINIVEAWLSTHPGQNYANVRKPLISSINLCHMIPLSAVWAGDAINDHMKAPALFFATTSGNTPFRFNLHPTGSDVGHAMILGPTGSGKSVLLNMIALSWLRYPGAQVFIIDKAASSLALTYGVEGDFFHIAAEHERVSFQPLRHIDNENERRWALDFIVSMCENEKVEVNAGRKNKLWESLNALSRVAPHSRTISGLSNLIQDKDVRDALEIYTINGSYGILDAENDTLSISKFIAFDVETLLDQPRVMPLVVDYIFHRLEEKFDGSPTLLCLDEAWAYLSNSVFQKKIRDWLLTARKKNVCVVFATAGISTVAENPITAILLESCPTRIFLPNSEAGSPDMAKLYTRFGLNERQIEILSTAIPKKEYYYQSPAGTRLFDLNLQEIALVFTAVSGKNDKKRIQDLYNAHGKSGFLAAYLEQTMPAEISDQYKRYQNAKTGPPEKTANQFHALVAQRGEA